MRFNLTLITGLIISLALSYLLSYTPVFISVLYLFGSLITYFLYAKDKKSARLGTWRVSEKTLQISALLFGWPGAILAQTRLRHKTKKTKFKIVFWIMALINIAGLIWIHNPTINALFKDLALNLENFLITHIAESVFLDIILILIKFRI